MVKFLRKLFLPTRCEICNIVYGFLPACPSCSRVGAITFLGENAPVIPSERGLIFFQKAYSVYAYEGQVQIGVLKMKFHNKRYMLTKFSQKLSKMVVCLSENFDCVVAVPSTRKRVQQQKGNIAQDIAFAVSKSTGIPCYENVLVKRFETAPQHTLRLKERQANLIGSMGVTNPRVIFDKKILLIDDIITSGNTIDYCSKILLAYGCKSVVAASYAQVINKKT